MTVQELIDELSKFSDKTQVVKYFDSELESGDDLRSFNSVDAAKYEGFDFIFLHWSDE